YSAIFIAVAALARSYKEAQSLVMPVYLAVSLPSCFAALPGMELSLGVALIPGAGVALLVKGLITSRLALPAAVVALGSTLGYAAIALALAERIYGSEETLGGERSGTLGERLRASLGLGPRLALRQAPAPAEAMTLYSIVVVLLVFVALPLQQRALVRGLLITQWALLLGSTLVFLRLQGIGTRDSLAIKLPSLRVAGAAALLGMSAWLLLGGLTDLVLSR